MLEFFFELDPTVQVALIGIVGTIVAAAVAIIRVWIAPESVNEKKQYGPQPTLIVLSDYDRMKVDLLSSRIDRLASVLERQKNKGD